MSGYQDPFSGFFNLPTLLYFAWAGFIVFVMLCIFIGFDNDGILHRIERRLGIRNVDEEEDDL